MSDETQNSTKKIWDHEQVLSTLVGRDKNYKTPLKILDIRFLAIKLS